MRGYFTQKGLTMIEVLISISITVIVVSILFAFMKEGFVSFDRTVTEADIQLDVRHKIDILTDEIRSSKKGDISGQQYPNLTDGHLVLFVGTEDLPKTIEYRYEDDKLIRKYGSEAEVFLEGIENMEIVIDEDLVTVKLVFQFITNYAKDNINKEISIQVKPRGNIGRL